MEKKVDSKQELYNLSGNKFLKRDRFKGELKKKSIDINGADAATFTLLPGIGAKTALNIIELRTIKGNFKNIEELLEVKGIGEVKYNNIKQFIFIEKTK